MGSGRAGFCPHEWVERLLLISYGEGHSATAIHPEWRIKAHLEADEGVALGDMSLDPRRATWMPRASMAQPSRSPCAYTFSTFA
jgi:hypothetical protein